MNMKKLLNILLIAFPFILFAQVGIGRDNPRGALDINDNTGRNNHGLVLPTTTNPSLITNPQTPPSSAVVPGTIVYDETADCIKLYKRNKTGGSSGPGWSECLNICTD